MKKTLASILTIIFTFTVMSICYAGVSETVPAEKKAEQTVAPTEKPKIKQITGEVKSIDPKAMTVTVMKKIKDQVKEITAVVIDKTKITMNKDKKTLSDLKVGDKVTMKYTESAGKNIAKSISIKPAASAEKK